MQTVAANSMQSLSDAIDIGFLEVSQAKFFKTEGGFTGLHYKGTEYKRICLRRALPLGDPSGFISIADHENKEIAIIRSLADFSGEQLQIVLDELDSRYYCPQIHEIKSIKDKLGYVYMEMVIGGKDGKSERTCAIKDVNRNIRMLKNDKLIIFDVDGNRYIIPSLEGLEKKSLKRLEPFLF